MTNNLRDKTFSGAKWLSIRFASQEGLHFITSIILARLLLPGQFGILGMLAIFIAVSSVFIDGGLGSSLIQRKNLSQVDCNTIFYVNIVIGVAATASLFLAAPFIANIFKQPILTPLARFLSLQLLISSFIIVQRALRQKELDYRSITLIQLFSGILSAIIGITMALKGFGVLALATQHLAIKVFSLIFYWTSSSWHPTFSFSFSSLKEMFGFGFKLLSSNLLDKFFRNIYFAIIGWAYTPAALGFYTKAFSLKKIPSEGTSRVVSGMMFPVFSTIQDDPTRIKRGMRKTMQVLCLVTFPLMIGMIATAKPLIHTLIGTEWLPSVPLLQVLGIGALLYPLQTLNISPLQALGRSDLCLRLNVIKKIITVIIILVTIWWGVIAIVVGQAVGAYISYYINTRYTAKLIDYPAFRQITDILPNLFVAAGMGIVVYSLHWLPFPNPWSLLSTQVVIGGIIYLIACYLIRFEAYIELIKAAEEQAPILRPILAKL